MEKTVILQTLVGSRAHGLNDPDSDYDYRGVFIVPTKDILKLGAKPVTTHWIEGDIDDTSWELAHFLHLATKCNPTILEAFVAPVKNVTGEGVALRMLFDKVWNSKDVFNAFQGYSHNQRKKFLEDKDKRAWKYACAYIRTLWQAQTLLESGTLMVDVNPWPERRDILLKLRRGEMAKGAAIDLADLITSDIQKAYEKNPNKESDLDLINDFLLAMRSRFWGGKAVASHIGLPLV